MKYSNRHKLHWLIVVAEILVFIAALFGAYFCQLSDWPKFAIVSAVATLIFVGIKLITAYPAAIELLVREDMAYKIAMSAERYGVCDYFNMQSAADQNRRNTETQKEIEKAQNLWLCANSGASYLEPSIYRHWTFVEKRLNQGVEFKVVLLDPYSEEKLFRNKINVSGENFDSKINIENLIKLQNKYKNIEIKFAKNGMHATVFATENSLFFDPYQVGAVSDRIENRSFCLKMEIKSPIEGVGLYRLFRSHFETLWRSSVSFQDWLLDSKDKLPPNLPNLNPR